jgi:hypothetical protein
MISSRIAQEKISECCYSDKENDYDLYLKLNLLVCQGKFDETKELVQKHDKIKNYLLNHSDLSREYGNILHVSIFWNNGRKGRAFFDFFIRHGTRIMKNGYNEYPWEQKSGNYLDPIDDEIIGERDDSEFEELYNELKTLNLKNL